MSEQLDALLDAVHASLLAGAFDDLPGHSERLEQAMAALPMPSGQEARRLRAKSLRNESCLKAALAGIQAARIRIQEIRKAAAGLTTYDRSGVRAIPSPSAAIPKRV